jgi:hypothetical protein
MRRLHKKPINRAFPDVKVPEPKLSKLVVFLCRLLGRLYLFLFFGVAKITVKNGQPLFDSFKRTLAGQSRCIIAFRHPNGGEPQLLGWFFLFKLRGIARRHGVKFSRFPHALFVYSYEVVRWGGWAAKFVMPNIAAMPIHHAKMDSQGMARIYKALEDGAYPLALAPEGQVSYTTDDVPRLEPGVIRIGFHVAQRLEAKGEKSPVEILPVSVYFRFGPWGKIIMKFLLEKIEKYCGFPRKSMKQLALKERLIRCREHILEANEARYQIKSDPALSYLERMDRVIDAAITTSEQMLGLKSEGDLFARMYRVRQICWDKIVLPGVKDFKGVSRVMRNITDMQAGEAWYVGRHQEMVDFCWYFRGPCPDGSSSFHRKIEYVQNLWDFANRTMGGEYSNRINIFPRKMVIHAAEPINLSAMLPGYKDNKKTAISSALSDLEKAYIGTIREAEA